MMTRDQIQTVLDALEYIKLHVPFSDEDGTMYSESAIAILTAALAEPSEPVAEVAGDYNTKHIIFLPAGIALEVGDKLFTHPAPSKPSLADIRGAVARGWCTERNAYKTMDVDLAEDIADAVWEKCRG